MGPEQDMISPMPYNLKKHRFRFSQNFFTRKTVIRDTNDMIVAVAKRKLFSSKRMVYGAETMSDEIFSISKRSISGPYYVYDALIGNKLGRIEIKNKQESYWRAEDLRKDDVFLIRWNPRRDGMINGKRHIHFKGKNIGVMKFHLSLTGFESDVEIKKDRDLELDRRLLISSVLCMQTAL